MDKQKTGELIRNARIKKGYTQVELGDLIGVTNKVPVFSVLFPVKNQQLLFPPLLHGWRQKVH